jgi:hypothetical protein
MSLKVAITVDVDNVSFGKYTIVDHASAGGDNPALTAMNAERAIVEAGRRIIDRIVAMDGDAAADPNGRWGHEPRPITRKA